MAGGRGCRRSWIRSHRVYDARGILTDENGRDLLTNQDRSDLVRRARRPSFYQIFRTGDATVARAADDGRYWFFYIVPRVRVGSWFLLPEHVFVIAAGVLLCYWLALYLTSPVRKLEKAVERFGRGDLAARVGSNRSDELGQLARTFDRMAERMETLLTAERRLLLDISHELRSPLARLGVAVELARSGDDLNSALNRIQKESDRLNALVGQLLQVTRAEGDPSSLRRAPLRLDELVRQLVEDSSIEAAAHGCELKYEKREPVTVAGDPELLRPGGGERDSQRHPLRAQGNGGGGLPGAPQRQGRGGSAGPGLGRTGRGLAAAVRRVLPGGRRPRPRQRRHRAGPLDRAPRHGAAQGQYSRQKRAAGIGGGDGAAGGIAPGAFQPGTNPPAAKTAGATLLRNRNRTCNVRITMALCRVGVSCPVLSWMLAGSVSAQPPQPTQFIPNQYILLLEDAPVSARFAAREQMRTTAAVAYRQQVETKQAAVRQELAARNFQVFGSVSVLVNAIFVGAPASRVAELQSIPGVIGVRPVRRFKLALNRATQLMNAPAAWNVLGGASNAGKGIKIAILDSGIDQTHPAFQDSTLPMPAGFPICTTGHPEDCAYTSNKVIVARSYVRMLAAGSNPRNPAADSMPDDYSPRDRDGHGTAVASCAAANSTATPAITTTGGPLTIVGHGAQGLPGQLQGYGKSGRAGRRQRRRYDSGH